MSSKVYIVQKKNAYKGQLQKKTIEKGYLEREAPWRIFERYYYIIKGANEA